MEWNRPAHILPTPFALPFFFFLLSLAFDGVITVQFVKSRGKGSKSDPQSLALVGDCVKLLLLASPAKSYDGDRRSCFCGFRNAPVYKNWAKALQIFMVSGWGCL